MPHGTGKDSLAVCLIEQNPLALEFVSGILHQDPSISVLGTEALATRTDKPSATIIFVVDNCGLPLPLSECLRRLRFHYPAAKYTILDRELSKEDLLRLLWLKIDGFVPYGEVPRTLLAALHSVAQGNIWISREVLREYVQCAREARWGNSSRLESMTNREIQILELVGRRLSNKEIADILHVRESTVKFHLSNIYSKLQISNRHDIIRGGLNASGSQHILSALIPCSSKG